MFAVVGEDLEYCWRCYGVTEAPRREATGALKDLSFDSIAAAGPNGAYPHYHPTHRTNRRMEKGNLLLVDSGGQYLDGTTDITRTVKVLPPSGVVSHGVCFPVPERVTVTSNPMSAMAAVMSDSLGNE